MRSDLWGADRSTKSRPEDHRPFPTRLGHGPQVPTATVAPTMPPSWAARFAQEDPGHLWH